MMIRRLTAVLVLVGMGLVSLVTPAFAHAELISSTPAKGASLADPPAQLQLTFNEPVSPESITVAGPAGAQWTVGQVKVEGPVVTAPLTATGPEGAYTISYRVLSEDGDPVTGTIPFTMTKAATGSTTTAPPSTAPAAGTKKDEDSGLPAWMWITGLAVLLAAGSVIGRRFVRPPSVTDER